jgi:hypothetical protein
MNDYVIAKYIRLSIEDEKTESMSIPHQRLLLDRHIEELDIPNAAVLEFVDNGHTGVNMERAAVQEMLELVRSGRVHCIAVKDFSRFSRNAMDSGYFIEQVFPLFQVRFISVDDNFDSDNYKNDTGGIDIAFKFLMHEYYSADLSKKVKSAKRILMQRGDNIVANAIYGYRKNGGGKWEPDPEPAEIVKQIFSMALCGDSTTQIRDKLCAERIPTPKEYIERKRGKDIDPSYMWTTRMIQHTLENVQYTGCYVSGKQEPKAVGSHSKIHTDKSTWIVIEGSHPPIISKEDFAAVQALLSRYKKSTTAKPVSNPLEINSISSKRKRMISGERMPSNVIYGYAKDDSGNLVIDPASANIVLKIYRMAAQGVSVREIRDKLTDAGYPTPMEYIKLGRGYDIIPTCLWTDKCVRATLQNIQYAGAYVSGRILKDHKTGKKYHTAKSDWIVIPGKNPPIVSMELFEEVQRILENGTSGKRNTRSRDYLLRGDIVKCGCCGYALSYDDSTRNAVYRCFRTLADHDSECRKLKIDAAELDDVTLAIIRKQAEVVLNIADLAKIRKIGIEEKRESDYGKEIRDCIEQRQQAYEQFVLDEIDRETYQSLRSDCAERLGRLNTQLTVFRQAERDKQEGKKAAVIAKHTLSDAATPREIVETLIDKIFVFPDKRIEIRWKIADFAKVV